MLLEIRSNDAASNKDKKEAMEKHLLKLFLELYVLNDKIDTWTEEKFSDNPPRLIRLQMINSYLQALEITATHSEFIEGLFITDSQLCKWDDFKIKMEKRLPFSEVQSNSSFSMKVSDMQSSFKCLMNYRLNAALLLSSNDVVYAASGEFKTVLSLMNNINRKLSKELKKIDLLLAFCMNPNGIIYTKEELKRKYNFPKANLMDVDLEWM